MKLLLLLSVCAIVSWASAYPRKSRVQKPIVPQDDYNAVDGKWAPDNGIDSAIPIDDEDEWSYDGIVRPGVDHSRDVDSSDSEYDDSDWSNDSDFSDDDSGQRNQYDDDDDDDDDDDFEYYQPGDRNGIDQYDRPAWKKQEYNGDDWIPQTPPRPPPKTHLENEWPHRDTQNNEQRWPFFPSWHRVKTRGVKIR